MRNVFDQYSQPENRLSHALATALHEDQAILKGFLRLVGAKDAPRADQLRVVEQRLPGEDADEADLPENEGERRGLPDICIYQDSDEEPWMLAIESKAQAKTSDDQIARHIKTLKKHRFDDARLVVLTIDPSPPPQSLPKQVIPLKWREVYAWLRREHAESAWSRRVTEYMEVFESKMVAADYSIRGTITMFDGLRFDDEHPYTYNEAKRLLRLMGEELRKDKRLVKLGMDPEGEGRGAITGRAKDGVWDFLPLRAAKGAALFTDHPHLTFNISRRAASAYITVPNGVKGGFRNRLKEIGRDGFLELARDLEENLRPIIKRAPGSKPNMYVVQRHFPSQRSSGIEDARLSADLRTAVPKGQDGVKFQPEWFAAMYQALCEKRSNIQFGVGVEFPYTCEKVRSPEVLDLFAATWVGLGPVLELAAPRMTTA